MAATPSPPDRPSERERDVMREIEQATSWPAPDSRRAGDEDTEKPNPEEGPCPPSTAP